MQCPVCKANGLRFGKNRNGTQRFICRKCFLTFSERRDNAPRVFADRQLTMKKATRAIRLLMEGTSVRGACRLLGMAQHTLLDLLQRVGKGCERLQREIIRNVACNAIECDELWSFVWCREKTRIRKGYPEQQTGECYTWTAVESRTKLIMAYAVGKRDNATAMQFARNLRHATTGHFQIDTDGLGIYRSVIPVVFGRHQDHAQVVKNFNAPVEGEARYSPPEIVSINITAASGWPNLETASTSMVERSNLTVRMMLRRFTRLTNAHSRKWECHTAALGLLFGFYNFVRPHMTLTAQAEEKQTPAMASGLTDHVWTVEELIERAVPEERRAIAC
jgi:IS1 family transposase/transposase-like protein